MSTARHPLLDRQLHRLGIDPARPPTADGWATLLDRVSHAYDDADSTRYLVERSLAVSSQEMGELNTKLHSSSQTLAAERNRLSLAS